MSTAATVLLALCLAVPIAPAARPSSLRPHVLAPLPPPAERVADEVLVKVRATGAHAAKADAERALATAMGLERLPSRGLDRIGAVRFRIPAGSTPETVAAALAASPEVEYAEPNVVVYPAAVPSDPLYAGVDGSPTNLQRWALGGVGDERVLNAEAAWDVTKGDPSVVIAVVDSGVHTSNPELKRLWVNRAERAGNGTDDDQNGYVDDVRGWNFVNGNGDVNPTLGNGLDEDQSGEADDNTSHGTSVATIIGAAHDEVGMAGAAPDCTIMPVKIFSDDQGATVSTIVDAIEYAVDNGADVVNLSFATYFKSDAMKDAITFADSKRCVIVAAAGNGNAAYPQFPASFSQAISVGGSDGGFTGNVEEINGRWAYSQFGPGAVAVVAPAKVLASGVASVGYANEHPDVAPGETIYEVVEGTSFAAPFVSALAGLIISRDKQIRGRRTLDGADVKAMLLKTAKLLPDDKNDVPNGGVGWARAGRVDFAVALEAVPGAGTPNPSIRTINYHRNFFRVLGDGFSPESTIEINGKAISLPVRFSYADGMLEVQGNKQSLSIKGRKPNEVVVIERGVRSPVFVYQR